MKTIRHMNLILGTLLLSISSLGIALGNEKSNDLGLQDVTQQWVYRYDTPVSAFPSVYDEAMEFLRTLKFTPRENTILSRIYHFYQTPEKYSPIAARTDFYLRRLEVYYTGDDAEKYPPIFFITNAEQKLKLKSGKTIQLYVDEAPRVYTIRDLSGGKDWNDAESGKLPRTNAWVNYSLSSKRVADYILKEFLNPDGTVSDQFTPVYPSVKDLSRYK